MGPEIRDAVKKHIGRAIAEFHIPEEYHGDLKNDPLYVHGEPVGVIDFLPSIRSIDPGGQLLFDQVVEAAVAGVEKALERSNAQVTVRDSRPWHSVIRCLFRRHSG